MYYTGTHDVMTNLQQFIMTWIAGGYDVLYSLPGEDSDTMGIVMTQYFNSVMGKYTHSSNDSIFSLMWITFTNTPHEFFERIATNILNPKTTYRRSEHLNTRSRSKQIGSKLAKERKMRKRVFLTNDSDDEPRQEILNNLPGIYVDEYGMTWILAPSLEWVQGLIDDGIARSVNFHQDGSVWIDAIKQ